MDFADILMDAYGYTKEGVLQNRNRWLKLILAILCLGIPFNGYTMRVYRGSQPAPEADQWRTLFVDGLKLVAVALVYIIPLFIIMVLFFGVMLAGLILSGNPDEPGILAMTLEMVFMLVSYVVEFVLAAFLPIAYIRLARTGVFSEAFNFSAILGTIGKIGWLNYIIAVILVAIVIGVPLCIVFLGFLAVFLAALWICNNNLIVMISLLAVMVILLLIIIPVINVFHARYLTRVYGFSGE